MRQIATLERQEQNEWVQVVSGVAIVKGTYMRPFLTKQPVRKRVAITIGSIGSLTLIILSYVLIVMGITVVQARPLANQIPPTPIALTTPTDVALEKSRLENEKLSAEIAKLQREIQPNLWTLFLANIPVLVGAIVGVIGIGRWMLIVVMLAKSGSMIAFNQLLGDWAVSILQHGFRLRQSLSISYNLDMNVSTDKSLILLLQTLVFKDQVFQ